MATGDVVVIARLQVTDFDTWYAEYQQMHPTRASYGERGHDLYRDADDPNVVVVVFAWDDLANARRYFEGDELAASVSRARAAGAPEVRYLLRDDGPTV
jgi:quinol monooxygenase YgiN